MLEQSSPQSFSRPRRQYAETHQVEKWSIRTYEGVRDCGLADHEAGSELHLELQARLTHRVGEEERLEVNQRRHIIIVGLSDGGIHGDG